MTSNQQLLVHNGGFKSQLVMFNLNAPLEYKYSKKLLGRNNCVFFSPQKMIFFLHGTVVQFKSEKAQQD